MKRIFILLGIAVILFGTFLVIWKPWKRFTNASFERTEPEKLDKVPASAKWAGGVDGGDWILCEYAEDRVYTCQIFSDWQGAKISSGRYCLKTENSSISLTYHAYDGETIFLEEGILLPIGEHVYYHGDSEEEAQIVSYPENTCTSSEHIEKGTLEQQSQ